MRTPNNYSVRSLKIMDQVHLLRQALQIFTRNFWAWFQPGSQSSQKKGDEYSLTFSISYLFIFIMHYSWLWEKTVFKLCC